MVTTTLALALLPFCVLMFRVEANDLVLNVGQVTASRFYPSALVVLRPRRILITYRRGINIAVKDQVTLVEPATGDGYPEETRRLEELRRRMVETVRVPPFDGLKKLYKIWRMCRFLRIFGTGV